MQKKTMKNTFLESSIGSLEDEKNASKILIIISEYNMFLIISLKKRNKSFAKIACCFQTPENDQTYLRRY